MVMLVVVLVIAIVMMPSLTVLLHILMMARAMTVMLINHNDTNSDDVGDVGGGVDDCGDDHGVS